MFEGGCEGEDQDGGNHCDESFGDALMASLKLMTRPCNQVGDGEDQGQQFRPWESDGGVVLAKASTILCRLICRPI